MNKIKSYAVIGLGGFGSNVALALMEEGMEVMVLDSSREKVNAIAPQVTYAMQLDASNEIALKSVGIERMDGVVIAIGENLEASVMATILCKEMGVKKVIVKAETDLQKAILTRVGADEVILPEKESGYRLAKNIAGNFRDFFSISENLCIVEVPAKGEWIGKTIKELNFRKEYHLNIISIKSTSEEEADNFPNPDRHIRKDDMLIVAGKEEDIEKFL